jgi:hypothetical protein
MTVRSRRPEKRLYRKIRAKKMAISIIVLHA